MLNCGRMAWGMPLWGLFLNFSFECHLYFWMSAHCGTSKMFPFLYSSYLHCFPLFLTFLMALYSLLTAMKQTEPGKFSSWDMLCHVGYSNLDFLICTSQCTVDYSQAIPFCIWFCACGCPHLATNAAATSVKWLETWDRTVRNRESWILMLLPAGFCCAFTGQHCSYLLV